MTDLDWSRFVAAIGRLAAKVDDAGRDDLTLVLDFVEDLIAEIVPNTVAVVDVRACIGCGRRAPWCVCGRGDYR